MKKPLNSITIFVSLGLALVIPFNIQAQWSVTGNNIYSNKTGNVGISNGSLFNAVEKLQIKGGNLLLDYGGIGQTGNLYFGGKPDANQSGLRLSMVQNGNGYIDLRTGSGSSVSSNGLIFRADITNNPPLNSERMRITASGNVGINTSSLPTGPTEKLQIDKGVLKLSSSNAYGGPMILFSGNPAAAWVGDWGIEYVPTGNFRGLNIWKPFGSPNGGNNYLFLADNTGNVGIRTNNPTANFTVNGNILIGDPGIVALPTGYKLYVQSGILTEKVKVAVINSINWADYVFAENYKLKPIGELESYVKFNKHLPNVPSADEVVKNGIDLAKMDATLLEKIEELFLYIIEQDKRIEALEKKLAEEKK